MTNQRLIVGIGNELRGDDVAGLEVARRLKSLKSLRCEIRESDGEPGKLMDLWSGYEHVIAIDAVVTNKAPSGTVHRWDAASKPLPAIAQTSSSHSLGLSEAIELARVFNKLPNRVEVIGIEGEAYDYGTAVSPEVSSAIDRVVAVISQDFGGQNA